MATQAEQLPKNIDKLLNTVYELRSKTFFTPPVPSIDIEPVIMTKRQIAKKMLLISAGVISATGKVIDTGISSTQSVMTSANVLGADVPNQDISSLKGKELNFALNASQMIGQSVTPESAHFIVYGKFKRDADGNLIDNEVKDPDCVFKKLAMADTHPTMAQIQVMITQVVKTLKMLGIKQQELLDEIAHASIAIPAAITAIASAPSIFPSGSGIPVAFSAFQSLISSIMGLVSKISGVAVDIEYLNYIPLLVEAQKLDAILGMVNNTILAINSILLTIDGLTKIIPSVPTPPGVGNQPGEPIEVTVTATPDFIKIGQPKDVTLKAEATKGSWEYKYIWNGPNGFNSDKKEVVIKGGPVATSTYTVTVIDKKDRANKIISNVMVLVGV